jgi:hypothetical protein
MVKTVIGVDLGGTAIKIGKFDLPSEAAEISHFGNVGLAATSGIYENDIEIGSEINGAISYNTLASEIEKEPGAPFSEVTLTALLRNVKVKVEIGDTAGANMDNMIAKFESLKSGGPNYPG